LAVGASFTGATVTVNACELEYSPSVTVAVNDSLPLKLAEAEKLTLDPSTVAVISVPPDTEYDKSSPSISLPDRDVEPDPSSSKVTVATAARVGASFTGVTVTVNVCVPVKLPSVTVAVKSSEPLKFSVAVNVTVNPFTVAVISVPSDTEYVKPSPSISLPDK